MAANQTVLNSSWLKTGAFEHCTEVFQHETYIDKPGKIVSFVILLFLSASEEKRHYYLSYLYFELKLFCSHSVCDFTLKKEQIRLFSAIRVKAK